MWVVDRPTSRYRSMTRPASRGAGLREAARQPSGPPAQRDPVMLEHGDDVGVGVEGVEEHDRVGLGPVGAVAYGDAVRMQGERDQVGVDAEVAADLFAVHCSSTYRRRSSLRRARRRGRRRSGWPDDIDAVVGAPAGHGGQADVVGGGDVGPGPAGGELSHQAVPTDRWAHLVRRRSQQTALAAAPDNGPQRHAVAGGDVGVAVTSSDQRRQLAVADRAVAGA